MTEPSRTPRRASRRAARGAGEEPAAARPTRGPGPEPAETRRARGADEVEGRPDPAADREPGLGAADEVEGRPDPAADWERIRASGAGGDPDWERFAGGGRTSGGEAPQAGDAPPSLGTLLMLLEAVRAAVPRELDRQLTSLLRELLLTLRAVIDWYLERLDGRRTERRVEDIPID